MLPTCFQALLPQGRTARVSFPIVWVAKLPVFSQLPLIHPYCINFEYRRGVLSHFQMKTWHQETCFCFYAYDVSSFYACLP
jgi:hypothetical protein